MPVFRLLLLLLASLAIAPSEAIACSKSWAPSGLSPETTLLLVVPQDDRRPAGPGDIKYYPSDFSTTPSDVKPVIGYVVRVLDIKGNTPDSLRHALAQSKLKAILVPWGYRADCQTTMWAGDSRWLVPRLSGVVSVHLRADQRVDSMPVFDVFSANGQPYPYAPSIRQRIAWVLKDGHKPLTAEQYMNFYASLPPYRPGSEEATDLTGLRSWLAGNPALTDRWPVVESIELLRLTRGAEIEAR